MWQKRIEGREDDAAKKLGDLARSYDPSEIYATELEDTPGSSVRRCRDAGRRWSACATTPPRSYRIETGKPFSPVEEAGCPSALNASMIDARDYLASRAGERREQFAPEGPVVAFSGGQAWEDADLLWKGLDSIKARIPEMILATTARAKGCDAVAHHAWAASRGVKVIQFHLDRSQGNRAAFVRNDQDPWSEAGRSASSAKVRASSRTSPRKCGRPAYRCTLSASRTSAPHGGREHRVEGLRFRPGPLLFFASRCGAQGTSSPFAPLGTERAALGRHCSRPPGQDPRSGSKKEGEGDLRFNRKDEMSITFRIATTADDQRGPIATINAPARRFPRLPSGGKRANRDRAARSRCRRRTRFYPIISRRGSAQSRSPR